MAEYLVADGHVVADFHISVAVHRGVVLYVRMLANDDLAHVGADDCAGPDAGAFSDIDVANDIGELADKCCGVDFRSSVS